MIDGDDVVGGIVGSLIVGALAWAGIKYIPKLCKSNPDAVAKGVDAVSKTKEVAQELFSKKGSKAAPKKKGSRKKAKSKKTKKKKGKIEMVKPADVFGDKSKGEKGESPA